MQPSKRVPSGFVLLALIFISGRFVHVMKQGVVAYKQTNIQNYRIIVEIGII